MFDLPMFVKFCRYFEQCWHDKVMPTTARQNLHWHAGTSVPSIFVENYFLNTHALLLYYVLLCHLKGSSYFLLFDNSFNIFFTFNCISPVLCNVRIEE